MLKTSYFLLILIFISSYLIAQPQGQWTWMNGTNTANAPAVYGTQGVFAPGNTPPGSYEGGEFTDHQGNFWMYGGLDESTGDNYCDLWEFKSGLNQWAWINGPGVSNTLPVYGTQGIAAPANQPGSRTWGVATWVDNNNNLWLFGGMDASSGNIYSDLWQYNITTGEWTWMSGPQGGGNPGIWGTLGIANPANYPGMRYEVNGSWTDANNNLWLFGGYSGGGAYSDMWKYSITTNEWTWVNGPNTTGGAGNWGTKGVASPANIPCGRMVYCKWKDNTGNFWFFGGDDGNSSYNDMWMYNPATNEFTWMSGTNNPNDPGSSGALCTSSANYCPSSRFENRAFWTRGCNNQNFELYGGAFDPSGQTCYGDLWDYNVTTNVWTLMNGTTGSQIPAVYGAITVSAPANNPGTRMGQIGWKDNSGNLWLFGGCYTWAGNYLNDMWRFVPDTTCPSAANGNVAASFTISPDTGCAPFLVTFTNTSTGGTSYQWNFGDGNTSVLTSPTHTYNTVGTDTVTLIVHSVGVCGNTNDTVKHTVVIVAQPIVNLGPDQSFCDSISVTLNAGNPGATYTWSTGAATESITVTNPGTYWVNVQNGSCSASDTVNITAGIPPAVNLGPDIKLCFGQQDTALNAGNPGMSYLWSTGETTQKIPVSSSGDYWVRVDDNGCFGYDTVRVAIGPPLTVSLGPDTTICPGDQMIIDAGKNYTSYSWIPGGESSHFIIINQPGTYAVTVTDSNGCTAETSIWINDFCPSDMYIPSAFTPDGNGFNNTFMAYCNAVAEFHMYVYNRWGQDIFESEDISQGWDGTFMGQSAPQDTYIYRVDYKLYNYTELQKHTKVGTVTLIR